MEYSVLIFTSLVEEVGKFSEYVYEEYLLETGEYDFGEYCVVSGSLFCDVCEYIGDVHEYDGDVHEYIGDTHEYNGDLGE